MAAAARSSSRAHRCTSPTGRTNGHRSPSAAVPAGRRSSMPADPHGALVIASLDHAGGQGSSAYSQCAVVGTVAGARGQQPRGPEVDGGRRHRRRRRRLRRSGEAGGRGRRRRRRDQRRPAQPRPPVPQRAHQPARRRMGPGPTAVRSRRDRRGPVGDRRRSGPRAAARRATNWRRGRASPRRWRRTSRSQLVAAGVDYLVVTRGSIFSAEKTRPDFHEPAGFNIDVCRSVHAALDIPVILQGSIVEWGQAEWALGGFDDPALCDGVEMTRAQIADPDVAPQARRRTGRPDPAVHPLQPDLSGARRAQPDRHLRRRTVERARDRGPRLVHAGAPAPLRSP